MKDTEWQKVVGYTIRSGTNMRTVKGDSENLSPELGNSTV